MTTRVVTAESHALFLLHLRKPVASEDFPTNVTWGGVELNLQSVFVRLNSPPHFIVICRRGSLFVEYDDVRKKVERQVACTSMVSPHLVIYMK